MTAETKRRGRPPKLAAEVKRHPIGIRTTLRLKDAIEAAAATTGRSVAQEVEARLESTFSRGDKHISIPLDLAAAMIRLAEERTGQRWTEDLVTWVAAKKAVEFLLAANQPAAPFQSAIADAQGGYETQLERWEPATSLRGVMGIGPQLKGGSPLDPDEDRDSARAELDNAKSVLRDAAAPARAMFLEGKAIAEELGDLFRLRPRKG